jgi:hypothetical protein
MNSCGEVFWVAKGCILEVSWRILQEENVLGEGEGKLLKNCCRIVVSGNTRTKSILQKNEPVF